MITIDLIDEQVTPTEKPVNRNHPVVYRQSYGTFDRTYEWAVHQQNELLRAAHSARLLKILKAGGPSIDVYRFAQNLKTSAQTLVERYVHRCL